jgi:hypothetical protein
MRNNFMERSKNVGNGVAKLLLAAGVFAQGAAMSYAEEHQVVRNEHDVPLIDLTRGGAEVVVVDREPGQYLGHVSSVLLDDGQTILATYPRGHGRGPIVLKKSSDGGKTWSERLEVPESWATSRETPTVYPMYDPQGTKRLILFSGLYPIRMAYSEDEGKSWTELEPIGEFGGIVAMGDVTEVRGVPGKYRAVFHDDGRFLRGGSDRFWGSPAGERGAFKVFQTTTTDGGLTWSEPVVIAAHPEAHLCEPGLVRSPDGKRVAMVMRENSRRMNSFVSFTDDDGETWSEPVELTASLTGDRHVLRYLPDGRILAVFRDMARESSTRGDFVGWVGSFEDIAMQRAGDYRLRLLDNKNRWDSSYPGLHVLEDGTIVAITYGHWVEGEEPFIKAVRFRLSEVEKHLP